jgi:hypothetical protein
VPAAEPTTQVGSSTVGSSKLGSDPGS